MYEGQSIYGTQFLLNITHYTQQPNDPLLSWGHGNSNTASLCAGNFTVEWEKFVSHGVEVFPIWGMSLHSLGLLLKKSEMLDAAGTHSGIYLSLCLSLSVVSLECPLFCGDMQLRPHGPGLGLVELM